MPLLKELAREKFAAVLEDVKDVAGLDIPAFAAAIDIIYTSTLASDRGLRDAIVPTLRQFKRELRNSDDFTGLIAAGLGEGDFALDVIDAWTKFESQRKVTWQCTHCFIQPGRVPPIIRPNCGTDTLLHS